MKDTGKFGIADGTAFPIATSMEAFEPFPGNLLIDEHRTLLPATDKFAAAIKNAIGAKVEIDFFTTTSSRAPEYEPARDGSDGANQVARLCGTAGCQSRSPDSLANRITGTIHVQSGQLQKEE